MPMPAESLSFRCRPRLRELCAGLLFCGAGAVALGRLACTYDRGLIWNGIHFGVLNIVFYWVLAGLFALGALLVVWIIFSTWVHGVPDIILTAESISFPAGAPVKRAFVLPLSEIENISLMEVSGQRQQTLHTVAKDHHIALNWLESKEAVQRLESELRERWIAVRGVPEYEGVFDF